MEMVELSLIEDNSSDKIELQSLIKNHYKLTNSPLAKRILDNWDEYLRHFIKITPIEYKKYFMMKKLKL